MSASSLAPGSPDRTSATWRRAIVVSLATVLLGLLTLPVSAPAVAATTVVPQAADPTHPGPDDDFPLFPRHCQSVYEQLPFHPCHVTSFGRHRPMVVAWGDSHTWMYQAALTKAARATRVNLVMIIAGMCPPAIAEARAPHSSYTECEGRDRLVYPWLTKAAARHSQGFKVILGAYWAGYRHDYRIIHDADNPRPDKFTPYKRRLINLAHHGVEPLFRRLGRQHVDVDVIAPAGLAPSYAPDCAAGNDPYQCPVPRRQAFYDEQGTLAYLHHMMSFLHGSSRLIDPSPAYCGKRVCHAHVDGTNTWFDPIHLGLGLTKTMAPFFRPSFEDLLR